MGEYEEYLRNPAFAVRFRAAYRGRHDPADAVWWLSKPGTVAPSGAVDPDQSLAALQRAAYARGATPAATDALAHLHAELAADREATLAAVAAARSVTEVDAEPAPDSVRDDEPLFEEEDADVPSRSRWALAVAVVAIVALIIGGWVGLQLGGSAVAAPQPTVTVTSTPSVPNLWPEERPKMLDVFDTPQTDEDNNIGDYPNTLDSSTFRALMPMPDEASAGTVSDAHHAEPYGAYAVRNTSGSVCLMLIVGSERAKSIYCVPESQIPGAGLTVSMVNSRGNFSITWTSAGEIEGTGSSL